MSWQGKPNYCWVKMVDGDRYKVTARQLGFRGEDRTEAKTLDAANSWWEAQSIKPQKPKPKVDPLYSVNKFGEPMILPGMFPGQLAELEQRIAGDPSVVSSIQRMTSPPTGQSVGHWSEIYLSQKLAERTKRGSGRYDNIARYVNKLVASIGADAPITAIDWHSWDKFYAEVMSTEIVDTSQRDIIADCRNFVTWLTNRDLIPPVKNINETQVRVEAKAIEHFTKEELRRILAESKPNPMLYVFMLLFCNCGFRQSDVATLTSDMISKNGYLTRKRAKNKKKKDAPVVSWKLWPETIKAVNKVKSNGELLFVRDNGLPWVIDTLNSENKRSRDDVFRRELWKPFTKKHEWRLPSDLIRGSAGNLLKVDSEFTNQLSVQIKFLAQKPSGVALKHYLDPPQCDLDAAVMFLRTQLLE